MLSNPVTSAHASGSSGSPRTNDWSIFNVVIGNRCRAVMLE